MKLGKLTLHNIASIEDAEIDFSSHPLSDSDVFLISGKTGSGKSTILDAICLALYGTTPRLENNQMQGEVMDAGSAVKLSNPAQLLRENTGEGYAKLVFEGTDGLPYEACWSIARANKKPTGRIQNRKWTIKDLQSGMEYTKDAEVKAVVQRAVKLDFGQFCRTTMLAQGEFTRFLNSKDDDKAEILEMITGVDIYSRIGAKVYAITQQKRQEYEQSCREIEQIQLLTDEEAATRQAEIGSLQTAAKLAETAGKSASEKKQWLNKDEQFRNALSAAENALKVAIEAMETEEVRKEQAFVTNYRQTAEVRGQWAVAKKETRSAVDAQARIERLRSDFAMVCAGKAHLASRRKELSDEQRELQDERQKQIAYSSVFDQAQTLDTRLADLLDAQSAIKESDALIAQYEKKIKEQLAPERDADRKSLEDARAARTQAEQVVATAETQLKAADLDAVRKERRQLQETLTAVRLAQTQIIVLQKHRTDRAEEEAALVLLEQEIAKAEQEKKILQAEVEKQKQSFETAEKSYNAAKEAVKDYVATLRRTLSAGDTCPVCLRRIENALPTDADVEARLRPLEEQWNEARTTFETEQTRLMGTESRIAADRKSLMDRKDRLAHDSRLPEYEKAAQEALLLCGLDTQDEQTLLLLEERQKAIEGRQVELDAREQAGKELEEKKEQARKAERQAETLVQQVQNRFEAADQAVKKAEVERDTALARQQEKASTRDGAQSAVGELLRDTPWSESWSGDPAAFREKFRQAAHSYTLLSNRLKDLEREIAETDKEQREVTDRVQEILTLLPDWNAFSAQEPQAQDNLSAKVQSLKEKLIEETSIFQQSSGRAKSAEEAVDTFLQSNPTLNRDTLAELADCTVEQVADREAVLKKLSDVKISARATLNDRKNAYAALQANKPAFAEGDTIESLETAEQEARKKVQECHEAIGALQKELETNEKNLQIVGNRRQELEAMRQVYADWDRLNHLIGDNTGNRFRRIAQSYVLGNLVHAANRYMRDLTDRYVLKVNPGTFVILLEDAYQGYASRAASTISGGESFLVSLSLALALSDIGDGLSVDTLFIDEGFGTLSGGPLQNAVSTLKSLRSRAGRHVGIISHIEELQERIPVQILVEQNERTATSTVRVSSGLL